MKIESPLPAHIAYSCGYFDDLDLIAWTVDYVPKSEHFSEDPYLVELTHINTKQLATVQTAGDLLRKFIMKLWPEFELGSAKSEHYTKLCFKKRLEDYSAGRCTPWQICRMISPIEQSFDFPEWLGSMYDACDQIEPDTQPSECRHLENAVAKTLSDLEIDGVRFD